MTLRIYTPSISIAPGSQQEEAELLRRATASGAGADEMVRDGVLGAHDSLISRPHIQHFCAAAVLLSSLIDLFWSLYRRKRPNTSRHRPHALQHAPLPVRWRPADCMSHVLPVAGRLPNVPRSATSSLVARSTRSAARAMALERDTEKAGCHFGSEGLHRHGKFEEERRWHRGIALHAEGDAATATPEDGAHNDGAGPTVLGYDRGGWVDDAVGQVLLWLPWILSASTVVRERKTEAILGSSIARLLLTGGDAGGENWREAQIVRSRRILLHAA